LREGNESVVEAANLTPPFVWSYIPYITHTGYRGPSLYAMGLEKSLL